MKNNEKCLKCGDTSCELKTIALPTKSISNSKILLDTFYLKICKNCGYTEMYSTKIIEKSKKVVEEY